MTRPTDSSRAKKPALQPPDDEMGRTPEALLAWMHSVAIARDDYAGKHRTVNLKFSTATLRMWVQRVDDVIGRRIEGEPDFNQSKLRLHHSIGPIRENDWFCSTEASDGAWRVFDVRPFGEISLVREDRARIIQTTKKQIRAGGWRRCAAPSGENRAP